MVELLGDVIAAFIGGLLGDIVARRWQRRRAARRYAALRAGERVRIPAALKEHDGSRRRWSYGKLRLATGHAVWRRRFTGRTVSLDPLTAVVHSVRELSAEEAWRFDPHSTALILGLADRRYELVVPSRYLNCVAEVFQLPGSTRLECVGT